MNQPSNVEIMAARYLRIVQLKNELDALQKLTDDEVKVIQAMTQGEKQNENEESKKDPEQAAQENHHEGQENG